MSDINEADLTEEVIKLQRENNELKNDAHSCGECLIKMQDWNDTSQEHINELKAMVNALRDAAKDTDDKFRYYGEVKPDADTIISMALAKSPEQCLADVKADAIESAMRDLCLRLDNKMPIDCIGVSLQEHADNLRKTTSSNNSPESTK